MLKPDQEFKPVGLPACIPARFNFCKNTFKTFSNDWQAAHIKKGQPDKQLKVW